MLPKKYPTFPDAFDITSHQPIIFIPLSVIISEWAELSTAAPVSRFVGLRSRRNNAPPAG